MTSQENEAPPEPPAPQPKLGRAPWTVLLLFATALLLFTKSAPLSWADASRMGTIQGLVEHGTLALDQTDFLWQGDKVKLDGHFYSHQPPMMALLGALPYGVLSMLGRGIADPGTYRILTWVLVGLPVLIGLLSLGLLMRRFGASESQAAWLLGAASFGTLLLPYSLVLNQHGLAAGLVLIALGAVTNRRLATAGVLLALATTVDLTAVFFAIALVIPIAWPQLLETSKGQVSMGPNPRGARGLPAILRYGLAALPILAVHFGINYAIAGDFKPLGMHTEGFEYPMSPFLFMNLTGGGESGPEGSFTAYLVGALFGESGLFSHHPVLVWAWILGVLGALGLLRQQDGEQTISFRGRLALVVAVELAALGILVFYLTQSRNFGGSSFGMRWFTVFAPAMFLLPALWAARSSSIQWRKALWVLAPLLVWSTAASGLGAVQPWSKFHYRYVDSPEGALDMDTASHPTASEHLEAEWARIKNFHMVFTEKAYDDVYQRLIDQHRQLYLSRSKGMPEDARRAWIETGLPKLQHVTDLLDRDNSRSQSRILAHFWLAKFHVNLGKRKEALEEYRIALALDPSFRMAKDAMDKLKAQPNLDG